MSEINLAQIDTRPEWVCEKNERHEMDMEFIAKHADAQREREKRKVAVRLSKTLVVLTDPDYNIEELRKRYDSKLKL